MNAKELKCINTDEYETFVDNVNREEYFKYIKESNGVTLKNIYDKFGGNKTFIGIILGIWMNHWNTFLKNGRVIKDNEMYYCLSPRNPNILKKNPKLNHY